VLCVFVGLSVEFARALFRIWLQEKDVQNVAAALKRAGLESKLMVRTTNRHFALYFDVVCTIDIFLFTYFLYLLSHFSNGNVQQSCESWDVQLSAYIMKAIAV